MAKVTDRNIVKKTTKPRRFFIKEMKLTIAGTSKSAIQKVAQKIHATSTEETTGGKDKRCVQITSDSGEPKQVYYGKI